MHHEEKGFVKFRSTAKSEFCVKMKEYQKATMSYLTTNNIIALHYALFS